MGTFLSNRLNGVGLSATLKAAGRAAELKAQGLAVVDFTTGQPDFATPDNVKKAGCDAILTNKTYYTEVAGIKPLRQAVVNKLLRDNGLSYSPQQILITCGAKQAIYNAMGATLNPGDEVIVPAPYWVSYSEIIKIVEPDAKIKIINCEWAENFKLTPKRLKEIITNRSKWLFLNSPNNPSGALYSRSELEALAEVLLEHPQVYIMSDDIYEHIIYDRNVFYNIAQVEPKLLSRTLIVNGVSKAYSMTGWRLGYAAGPQFIIDAMTILQSQSTSNASSISQWAALEALSGEQNFVEHMSKVFEERLNILEKILRSCKFIRFNRPGGGFFVFLDCSAYIGKTLAEGKYFFKNTVALAEALLEEELVVLVAGEAFGSPNYLRLSFSVSEAQIRDGAERIVRFFNKLQ